jgi:diacylglycerol O-acyltransferase / wax synthase
LPSLGVPWLMSAISTLYNSDVVANRIPTVANLVISNVPGPQVPLYMAGATMDSYFPVSIITHGLGLNVTLHSYNGSLDIGLIACKKAVPDIARFAKAMEAAHQELLATSVVVAAPAPAPVVKAAGKKRSEKATAVPDVSSKRPKIGLLQPIAVKKNVAKAPAKVAKTALKAVAKPATKVKTTTTSTTSRKPKTK